MLIKWIGAAVTIAATGLLGAGAARTEHYRQQDLEDLEKAISLLKSEVSFVSRPLSEALEAVSHRQNGVMGAFLLDAAQKLDSLSYGSASVAWEEAMAATLPSACLKKDDLEALSAFGRTLGYLDQKAQLNACDLLLDYLERARIESRETYLKNARVYRSLGILTGVLLAVVLL